jgi:hypothetical protein
MDQPDIPLKLVTCPACGGPSLYASSNAFRPFCSARCKSLDFGAWASESFSLPADVSPDDDFPGDPERQ